MIDFSISSAVYLNIYMQKTEPQLLPHIMYTNWLKMNTHVRETHKMGLLQWEVFGPLSHLG